MCIYFMDLRKINLEHLNKMNSSRIGLETDNDIKCVECRDSFVLDLM